MTNILNFTFAELKNELVNHKIKASRAYQLVNWLYRKMVFDFREMSDLPKDWREEISVQWEAINLTTVDKMESSDGESVKFLHKTVDGHYIESVLIFADTENNDEEDTEKRVTLCVSSQVGCPLGCSFCATAKLGFVRNLETSEIISQVLLSERYVMDRLGERAANDPKKRNIGNIVYMGMGEPLLNYENVMKSIRILNFNGGFNLGARHFTISTVGLIPQIKIFASEKMQIRLAVSLHTANIDKRKTIMPAAKVNSLPELMEALRYYQDVTGRRITFEYVMLQGINTSDTDALELKRLLYNIKYNLNLIAFNPIKDVVYSAPTQREITEFLANLKRHGVPYVVRQSKGGEIKAGCGQLGLYWKSLGK